MTTIIICTYCKNYFMDCTTKNKWKKKKNAVENSNPTTRRTGGLRITLKTDSHRFRRHGRRCSETGASGPASITRRFSHVLKYTPGHGDNVRRCRVTLWSGLTTAVSGVTDGFAVDIPRRRWTRGYDITPSILRSRPFNFTAEQFILIFFSS